MTKPSDVATKALIEMWDAHVQKLDAELKQKDAQAALEMSKKIAHAACKTEGFTGIVVRGCTVIEVFQQCIKLTSAEILE